MDEAEPQTVNPAVAKPAPAMGRVAAGGFVWSFGLSILAKIVATLAQLALARLLTQDDYGLYGLATATAIIPGVIRDAGIAQILVQRRLEFANLANAAFWMSLALGLLMGGVIAGVSPFVADLYHAPQVIPICLVLAITSPLTALTVVPTAKLQVDLRFRLNAVIGSVSAMLTVLLTVWFAYCRWGPLSFVLPTLVVATLRVPALWILAPAPIRAAPEIRRWPAFIGDSGLLVGTAACWAIVANGDNAILGLFVSSGWVGYYVFGFGLSLQTVQLLGASVSTILFPALAHLNLEPARQRDAFIRACRLSAMVTIPLALLPIACAEPLVHLLFKPRWWPVVPLLQILSLASAMATLGYPVGSYMMAQNRNRASFLYSVGMTVFFLVEVLVVSCAFAKVGAGLPETHPYRQLDLLVPSGPIGTAISVSLFHVIAAFTGLWIALAPSGEVWRPMFRIAVAPMLLSGLAIAAATWATHLATPWAGRLTNIAWIGNLLLIGVSLLTLCAVYGVLVQIFSPDIFKDLAERVRSMRSSRQANAAVEAD